MENVLIIGDMIEKRIGRGEDSDPILLSQNDSLCVGVLDGMGGAGSIECDSDYTKDGNRKTQAYVGSRIIRKAILDTIISKPDMIEDLNFKERLKNIILERYSLEKEKFPRNFKTSLKSSLIKEYPTTLALVTVIKGEKEYLIDSYWSGDSRNYYWHPNGFYQISKDDLKGDLDPLENIREDAIMSNSLQANGIFEIHHKRISSIPLSNKFIVISATDGCFGYYPSPMDFERILQTTLMRASSIEEWKKILISEIESVTGDDFSFGIALIGFTDFNDVKKNFEFKKENKYFISRNNLEREKKKYEKVIRRLENRVEHNLIQNWTEYKADYLKYMDNYE